MSDEALVPTVHQALVAAMEQVGPVGKGGHNDQQNFDFRGIDQVVNAVQPALVQNRVTVHPRLVSVDYANATSAKGSVLTLCRGVVAYVFTGPAGDEVEAVVAAEAFDSGDKATAKMMSVAFRTALLQALALPTGDKDPDSQTYERGSQADTYQGGWIKSRPNPADDPWASDRPRASATKAASDKQQKAVHAVMSKAGFASREDILTELSSLFARTIHSATDLTSAEASRAIETYGALADGGS